MRQERTVQASIFDVFAGHEIGRELKAMSEWLDAHRALLSLVVSMDIQSYDVRRHPVLRGVAQRERPRGALTATSQSARPGAAGHRALAHWVSP